MAIDLFGNTVLESGVTINGDYNKRITRDGLRIYLDAENTNSYQGGTSTWYDMSGYDNDCNWNSAPTWTAPGYFAFNGSTHYGTVIMNSTLDCKTEQTVMMMLRRTVSTKRENPWNQAYGGYGTWTAEIADTVNMYFGNAGASTTPYVNTVSSALTDNVWYFIASARGMDRDQKTHRIFSYVNATKYAQTIKDWGGPIATDSNNILIGNGYTSNFTGHIAMVLMYNRRLQPYEIAENFQAIRGRYSL